MEKIQSKKNFILNFILKVLILLFKFSSGKDAVRGNQRIVGGRKANVGQFPYQVNNKQKTKIKNCLNLFTKQVR